MASAKHPLLLAATVAHTVLSLGHTVRTLDILPFDDLKQS